MKNKFLRTFSAVTAALVMALSVPPVLGVNVGAATGEYKYNDLAGGETYFVKALVMDKNANVPKVTFTYTIDAIDEDIPATTGTMFVKKGIVVKSGDTVTAPTVASVSFTPDSTTFPDLQTADQLAGSKVKYNRTNVVIPDSVNLTGYSFDSSKQKYARDEVKVDLTGVTFKEPGIYRYKITEVNDSAQGISYDVTTTGSGNCIRYLDVYVEDDTATTDKTMKIAGYVLHKDNGVVDFTYNNTTHQNDIAEPSTKSNGFVNEYTSYDLTLAKKVTGNQASRDEYFEFTVNISGAVPGTKYDVDVTTNAQATTTENGMGQEGKVNNQIITVGSEGTATETYWLRNDQSIVIKGLASGTKYSIKENETVMNNEGYSTKIEKSDTSDSDAAQVGSTREFADSTTGIDKKTEVTYTNTKNGVVPTGILLTYTPYIIISVIAVAGIIFLAVRRRRNAE